MTLSASARLMSVIGSICTHLLRSSVARPGSRGYQPCPPPNHARTHAWTMCEITVTVTDGQTDRQTNWQQQVIATSQSLPPRRSINHYTHDSLAAWHWSNDVYPPTHNFSYSQRQHSKTPDTVASIMINIGRYRDRGPLQFNWNISLQDDNIYPDIQALYYTHAIAVLRRTWISRLSSLSNQVWCAENTPWRFPPPGENPPQYLENDWLERLLRICRFTVLFHCFLLRL